MGNEAKTYRSGLIKKFFELIRCLPAFDKIHCGIWEFDIGKMKKVHGVAHAY